MPTGTTYVDYTVTNASVLNYFTFPILDVDHIVVVRNSTTMVQGTNYTVNQSAGSITFLTAIAVSDIIRISRVTERDAALVTFVDGATTPASDLNLAFLQNFYISQETDDVGGLSLDKNAAGNYEANNIRIVNVGAPTANGDATTKSYVDQGISNALTYDNSSGYLSSWTFTGNGSQLAYTLTSSNTLLNDARNYLVAVSGVLQPFAAYTVTSNVLTFVAGNAPPNGSAINIVAIGFARSQIGSAISADKWTTPRTLSLSGDATGSASVDGSANASISVALATVNSADPSNLYTNVNIKVDQKGRVTQVANGSGATNFTAATSGSAGTAGLVPAPAAGQQYAILRGDASWVYPTTFSGVREWSTTGTFTWVVPININSVRVLGVGAAGGSYSSLGGGYGACAEMVFPVVGGETITIVIGAGGVDDNSNGNRTAGQSTSFGSYAVFGGGTKYDSSSSGGSIIGASNGTITGTASSLPYRIKGVRPSTTDLIPSVYYGVPTSLGGTKQGYLALWW